jgi:hypothetical protein
MRGQTPWNLRKLWLQVPFFKGSYPYNYKKNTLSV